MYSIHTNRVPSGKERWIDLHNLPLGDTLCHKLAGPDLFKQLKRMGLPVVPTMGWQEMALIYGDFLATTKEKETT